MIRGSDTIIFSGEGGSTVPRAGQLFTVDQLRQRHVGRRSHVETRREATSSAVKTNGADTTISRVPTEIPDLSLLLQKLVAQPTTSNSIKRWEGYVSEIGKESFSAVLRDPLGGEDAENEIAAIPLSAVSESDEPLLRVGALLYLTHGVESKGLRRKQLVTEVIFRRTPNFGKAEIAAALKRVQDRRRQMKKHSDDASFTR